jgi:hypothetical protein
MAYTEPGSRFQEDNYHVYEIDEDHLTLTGGGDFYNDGAGEVDEETWSEARALAEKYGMEITSGRGYWSGWSEYTPDPGDISVFEWRKKTSD